MKSKLPPAKDPKMTITVMHVDDAGTSAALSPPCHFDAPRLRCSSEDFALNLAIQSAAEQWLASKGHNSEDLTRKIAAVLHSFGIAETGEGQFLPAPRKRVSAGGSFRLSIRPRRRKFGTVRSGNTTPRQSPNSERGESTLRNYTNALILHGTKYLQKTEPFVQLAKDPELSDAHSAFSLQLSAGVQTVTDATGSPCREFPDSSLSRGTIAESLSLSLFADERKAIESAFGGLLEAVQGRMAEILERLRHCESRSVSLLQRLSLRPRKSLHMGKLFESLYHKSQWNLVKLQREITLLKAQKLRTLPLASEIERVKSEAESVAQVLTLREKATEEAERVRMTIEDLWERMTICSEKYTAKLHICEEKVAELNLELIRTESAREVDLTMKEREMDELRRLSANVLSITAEDRYRMLLEDALATLLRSEERYAPLEAMHSEMQGRIADLEMENSVLGSENSFLNKECEDLKYGMSLYDTAMSVVGPETVEKFRAVFGDLKSRWEESFRHELEMRAQIQALDEENRTLRERLAMRLEEVAQLSRKT